ncbi:MAG: hypothetical protein KAG28_00485 [Cocleimonas sp.]|nr:hypothetical protein [Cocleimonas sp.]
MGNDNNNEKALEGASQLYLLSWYDALDRLDTLLLEARHLQVNIISTLRVPELLYAIRYEEKYLWGDDWDHDLSKSEPSDLVNRWMVAYPHPYHLESYQQSTTDFKKNQDIRDRLHHIISSVFEESLWGKEQYSNYYTLQAIQHLKRKIFRDKLVLTHHALFKSCLSKHRESVDDVYLMPRDSRAEFMVLRGAILYHAAHNYVNKLSHYQSQLGRVIDVLSEGLPQSSLRRRRELGVYTDFLDRRTVSLDHEITALLRALGIENKDEESITLHNWSHDFSSSSISFRVNLSNGKQSFITNISTDYWMPERPDLQPTIAHEVAHAKIKLHLDNLSESMLSSQEDDFTYLLVRLKTKLADFSNTDAAYWLMPSHDFIKEICCDLLAASIEGFSYLFAAFLQLMSNEEAIYGLLQDDRGNLDTHLLDTLRTSIATDSRSPKERRTFYLRLHLIITWIELTHHRDQTTTLEKKLLEGLKQTLKEIHCYYHSLAATSSSIDYELFWHDFTQQMCNILKSSKAISTVKEWKQERTKEVDRRYSKKENHSEKYYKRDSTTRLFNTARETLARRQLWQKTLSGRPFESNQLNDNIANLTAAKKLAYYRKLKIKAEIFYDIEIPLEIPCHANPSGLYRYIYDIPWQVGMLRSHDLLWKPSDNKKTNKIIKNNDLLQQLHYGFPFGRDLFSLALEFYLHDADSPKDKCYTVLNLLKEIPLIKPAYPKLLKSAQDQFLEIEDKLKKLDENNRSENQKDERYIHILIDINKIILKIDDKKIPEISQLVFFIQLATNEQFESTSSNHQLSYANTVEETVRGFEVHEDFDKDQGCTNYMIGKIAVSSPYPSEIHNKNVYSVINNKNKYIRIKNKINQLDKHYSMTLGRYDILSIYPALSMCRCDLPYIGYLDRDKEKIDIEKDQKQENFYNFNIRREMSIPFKLGKGKWAGNFTQLKPIATLQIILKQRGYRLSFLHRLRMACKNTPISQEYPHEYLLDWTGKLFQTQWNPQCLNDAEDCAFLTDGWGDILIVFMSPEHNPEKINHRINNIYTLQNAIYQDCMVDRTRLTLMSETLHHAENTFSNNKDYLLSLSIRMLEDRHLTLSNQLFRQYLTKISKDYPEFSLKFYKIMGATDFEITISKTANYNQYKLTEIISRISRHKFVDHTKTSIKKHYTL